VLTWDDSGRPRRRRRLGRLGTGPGRTVTFCSGIAFPSTRDHAALCPRQARSTPSGQAIRCSDHKRRTTVRFYTTARADTAWASTEAHSNSTSPAAAALPHAACLGPPPPSWPGHAVLARARGLGPVRPAVPGSIPQGTGGPVGAFRAGDPSRPRPAAAPPGLAFPRHGQARLQRPPPAWRLPPSASAVSRGWSRPRTASDSGGAPHERFLRSRTCSVPGLHTPRRCPGRINLPEPARVKLSWRTRGDHVENAPASASGASRGCPCRHRSYRGLRCRRPGTSRPAERRAQADAARTRPPSPPSWCGPPSRSREPARGDPPRVMDLRHDHARVVPVWRLTLVICPPSITD